MFLKDENLNDYTLSASNDDSTYTEIEADITVPLHGYSFVTFTNTGAYRYWWLLFSQRGATGPNYHIYEIFLMCIILDLNGDIIRESKTSVPNFGIDNLALAE